MPLCSGRRSRPSTGEISTRTGSTSPKTSFWHVGGNHPLSGDYRGRDAIFEYFETVRGLTGGGLRSEPHDILADDSHGGVFTRVTADRGDRHLDVVLAQAYRINPDGKFTEYWALADDQDAVNAFWS